MDASPQMPPAPAPLAPQMQAKSRWLRPHVNAHIQVGPEFQAAIPELVPKVVFRPPARDRTSAVTSQAASGPQ